MKKLKALTLFAGKPSKVLFYSHRDGVYAIAADRIAAIRVRLRGFDPDMDDPVAFSLNNDTVAALSRLDHIMSVLPTGLHFTGESEKLTVQGAKDTPYLDAFKAVFDTPHEIDETHVEYEAVYLSNLEKARKVFAHPEVTTLSRSVHGPALFAIGDKALVTIAPKP